MHGGEEESSGERVGWPEGAVDSVGAQSGPSGVSYIQERVSPLPPKTRTRPSSNTNHRAHLPLLLTLTFVIPPGMSVKGTHSVLELLASYQANASESGSPPVSRFAAARLEREQSRLARHAAAGVGAEEEEVSGIEELVPPRLRVKPPLSTGQGTYSPTVPGTPNEVVSSPASAAKLGDTADLSASPRGSAKSQYVSKESDSVKSTNRGGSPVSEIPPFNPARSRSRPSSPTPSASSAQSFTTQATDAIVPMDLMARLRQKQKQQAAHHAHLATSPPTIAALPPRSPELVPLPSEAHEFHPVSPITSVNSA